MDFQHSEAQQIATRQTALWRSLCAKHHPPMRRDLSQSLLEPFAPYGFVAEWQPPRPARIRIAGAHLNALMQMEVRGMPLGSFITPESRKGFNDAMRGFFAAPAQLRMQLCAEEGLHRKARHAELLLLPLFDFHHKLTWCLGTLFSTVPTQAGITRFRITHTETRPLPQFGAHNQSTPPQSTQNVMASAQTAGFAEAPTPFAHQPAPKEKPYLKLVSTND